MDDRTRAWLGLLWRGGAWGYYWRLSDQLSQWTPTSDIAECRLGNDNVYMGVHPGKTNRGTKGRCRNEDVAAVNCLYADMDAKDYGGDMANVRDHIKGLNPGPNVVICSGGGYHCYWMVRETLPVLSRSDTDEDGYDPLDYIRGIQRTWQKWAGGDSGAKDLSRVLRLPDTVNSKYGEPRAVAFTRCNIEYQDRFDLAALCAIVEPLWLESAQEPTRTIEPQKPSGTQPAAPARTSLIDVYNQQTSIRQVLASFGYKITGNKFTRPDKDPRNGMSGTIRDETNSAYTFSSNDPAFDPADTSPSGAGCTLKPFDVLCRVRFNNNAKAAYAYLQSVVHST